jgi:hypothetical protein
MKTLEVRRHSLRKDGAGSQLSQEGVDLARRLGASTGPFARVVTSVVPRARETAIAMGFAVDLELVTMATDEAVYAEFRKSKVGGSRRSLGCACAAGGAARGDLALCPAAGGALARHPDAAQGR